MSFPPFVKKLINLIKFCDQSIGSWSQDGSEFEILNGTQFKTYIKPSTIGTFQRQLTYYGFARSKKDKNRWTFKHNFFHRDKPEMYINIKRNAHRTPKIPGDHRAKITSLELRINELLIKNEQLEQSLSNILNIFRTPNTLTEYTEPVVSMQAPIYSTCSPLDYTDREPVDPIYTIDVQDVHKLIETL